MGELVGEGVGEIVPTHPNPLVSFALGWGRGDPAPTKAVAWRRRAGGSLCPLTAIRHPQRWVGEMPSGRCSQS